MRLALGPGDVDEVGVVEPRDWRKHRPGDRDVVVVGEPAHDLDRGVADRREPVATSSARALLSISSIRRLEHVVEQADVVFVERLAPSRNSAVMRWSIWARRSGEPCWIRLPVPE